MNPKRVQTQWQTNQLLHLVKQWQPIEYGMALNHFCRDRVELLDVY